MSSDWPNFTRTPADALVIREAPRQPKRKSTAPPLLLTKAEIKEVRRMATRGENVFTIAEHFCCSVESVRRVLGEAKP